MALEKLPYLGQLGSGVDLVKGRRVGRVIDVDRFNGYCRKAHDGDMLKAPTQSPAPSGRALMRDSGIPHALQRGQLPLSRPDEGQPGREELRQPSQLLQGAGQILFLRVEPGRIGERRMGFPSLPSSQSHPVLAMLTGPFKASFDESFSYSHSETYKELFNSMKEENSIFFTVRLCPSLCS